MISYIHREWTLFLHRDTLQTAVRVWLHDNSSRWVISRISHQRHSWTLRRWNLDALMLNFFRVNSFLISSEQVGKKIRLLSIPEGWFMENRKPMVWHRQSVTPSSPQIIQEISMVLCVQGHLHIINNALHEFYLLPYWRRRISFKT